MITLHVLGSGSRGNCIALAADGAVLLVDAGFSAREIERRAAIAGLDLSLLIGIVLTHEHGDHAAGAPRLAERHRVPILASPGTWSGLRTGRGTCHVPIGLTASSEIGPFRVVACPTVHDAAEPVAVAVRTASGAGVGVAYDLGRPTTPVRYLLRDMSAIVLEANHDEIMLRTSGYPASVRQRIAGSGGHLSNRAAAELLVESCHPGLGAVVLAHLSLQCNTELLARAAVDPPLRQAGFRGELYVARQEEPLAPITVGH
ncbi:MAG: MBL fold metallo-hydrolase [Gemmatimonadota bacterium]